MQGFYSCREAVRANKSYKEFLEEYRKNYSTLKPQHLNLLLKAVIMSRQQDCQPFIELLMKQPNINVDFIETKDQKSILMTACQEAGPQALKILLMHNANAELKDDKNKTCLFYLTENKKKSASIMLSMILEANPQMVNSTASNNQSILMATLEKNKLQLAKILIEKGANVNQTLSDSLDTALHIAVKNLSKPIQQKGFKAIVRQLLMAGADITLKNKQGKTPLDMDVKFRAFVQAEVDYCRMEKNKKPNIVMRVNMDQEIDSVMSEAKAYAEEAAKIKLQIEAAKKDVETEETVERKLPPPVAATQQLQSYIETQLLTYQAEVNAENAKFKQLFDQLIAAIQKQLSKFKLKLKIFGSYATGLMMSHSDINLVAIRQLDMDPVDLINSVHLEIRDMNDHIQSVEIVEIVGNFMFKMVSTQQYKSKNISLTILDKNHFNQNIVTYILTYLQAYPQIKPVYFALQKTLYACHMIRSINNPEPTAIASYPLLIMVMAFVQSEHGSIILGEKMNTGRLLITFLKLFGFDFDYYQRSVLLPRLDSQSKAFMYPLAPEYFPTTPRLVVFDPIDCLTDIANFMQCNSVTLQKLFRMAHIIIHIHFNCNKSCSSREAIQKLAMGKYEDNPRPCCILKRLFNDLPIMLDNQYTKTPRHY